MISVTHKNISQTGAETVKNNKESTGFASIAIAGAEI